MGIVGFQWGDNKLTLLQNRDNWETRVINKADWVGGILGGRCEKSSGTWFGVTLGGRVASLVDSALMVNMVDEKGRGPEMIPIEFLKSNLSPNMFAAKLVEDEKNFHLAFDENDEKDEDWMSGRAYELIVADITSVQMVYISKPSSVESLVNTKAVAFGVHTLSLQGLDSNAPKDLRLKNYFNEMIRQYENKELPELYELAEKFICDPTEAVPRDEMTALLVDKMGKLPSSERDIERYGTTSTTAFVVDHTKKAMFYERYFEKDMWSEHDFPFNIV